MGAFDAAALCAIFGCIATASLWSENFGTAAVESAKRAWEQDVLSALNGSRALMLVCIIQILFEGCLHVLITGMVPDASNSREPIWRAFLFRAVPFSAASWLP